jgi:hypothetical protein
VGETTNRYETRIDLEAKIYIETCYKHQTMECLDWWNFSQGQGSRVTNSRLNIHKEQQLTNSNMGTQAKPQMVKINSNL